MRKQEGKTELEKVYRRIFKKDITFLAAHPLSHIIFCRIFHLLPPFCQLPFYVEEKSSPENDEERVDAPCLPVSTALYCKGTVIMVVADKLAANALSSFFCNFSTVQRFCIFASVENLNLVKRYPFHKIIFAISNKKIKTN